MTEEFLELAEGRVHVLRGGPADGTAEPVLFLHAAGGAGQWLEFHELLAGTGFEVIAPDHPGFGKSDEFPELDGPPDLDAIIAAYREATALARFSWVPFFNDRKLELRLKSAECARAAKLKAREAARRKDWCEKTSTELARAYDLIRFEKLHIVNMTAAAKGTLDKPGRNVAQAGERP